MRQAATFRTMCSILEAPSWPVAVLLLVLANRVASGADPLLRFIGEDDSSASSAAVIVRSQPLLYTTQILPLDDAGRVVAPGSAGAQADAVLSRLGDLLAQSGSADDLIVKLNVCAVNDLAAQQFLARFAERRQGKPGPALSLVAGQLPVRDAHVALDAVAVLRRPPPQRLAFVRPAPAPGAAGEARASLVADGPKVYVSGQAERGESLSVATQRTLESLARTLEFVMLRQEDVIQLKAFLAPMSEAETVRRVINDAFGSKAPPIVLVEWADAGSIEIELIAAAGPAAPGAPAVEYLTPPGMQASPIFSRVCRVSAGETIYTSGLYGTSRNDGQAEVAEVFARLGQVLEQSGSNFAHLAKATYYVSTADASRELNAQRPKFYDPLRPPAASKAMVSGTGKAGQSITLDMIAVPKPAGAGRQR